MGVLIIFVIVFIMFDYVVGLHNTHVLNYRRNVIDFQKSLPNIEKGVSFFKKSIILKKKKRTLSVETT